MAPPLRSLPKFPSVNQEGNAHQAVQWNKTLPSPPSTGAQIATQDVADIIFLTTAKVAKIQQSKTKSEGLAEQQKAVYCTTKGTHVHGEPPE